MGRDRVDVEWENIPVNTDSNYRIPLLRSLKMPTPDLVTGLRNANICAPIVFSKAEARRDTKVRNSGSKNLMAPVVLSNRFPATKALQKEELLDERASVFLDGLQVKLPATSTFVTRVQES